MRWDDEAPDKRRKHRDRELTGYLRHELAPFSPYYQRHFTRAGVDPARVSGLDDLRSVPPTEWEEFASDPGAFLLRPTEAAVARYGERRLVIAVTLGRLLGRADRVSRDTIEPRFKPVAWHLVGGLPIGSSRHDLERLAEAGSRLLAVAGLSRRDVLVTMTAAGGSLGHDQLVTGARRAGVAALHLGPEADPATVEAAGATVLAGSSDLLLALLEALGGRQPRLGRLHTVLVVGEDPSPSRRRRLADAGSRAAGEEPAVVAAWAPPGARALWSECPQGDGFHTYPDFEVLEVESHPGRISEEGDGELLWSALGWRGTAPFRLQTGEFGTVEDVECAACQRRGPLVRSAGREGLRWLEVLDSRSEVTASQVEVRRVNGSEELLVFLSLARGTDVARLLSELNPLLDATQYVVRPKREVQRRIDRHGRVADRNG